MKVCNEPVEWSKVGSRYRDSARELELNGPIDFFAGHFVLYIQFVGFLFQGNASIPEKSLHFQYSCFVPDLVLSGEVRMLSAKLRQVLIDEDLLLSEKEAMGRFFRPVLDCRRALNNLVLDLFPQIIGGESAVNQKRMNHLVQQCFSSLFCRRPVFLKGRRAAEERYQGRANGGFELRVIACIFLTDKDGFGPEGQSAKHLVPAGGQENSQRLRYGESTHGFPETRPHPLVLDSLCRARSVWKSRDINGHFLYRFKNPLPAALHLVG